MPSSDDPSRFEALRARGRPEDLTLSEDAFRWMAKLPRQARPIELGRRYPRIANRLAAIWTDRPKVDAYLHELLIDRRQGRQGFAPAIGLELARLRAHFDEQACAVEPGWRPGVGR